MKKLAYGLLLMAFGFSFAGCEKKKEHQKKKEHHNPHPRRGAIEEPASE